MCGDTKLQLSEATSDNLPPLTVKGTLKPGAGSSGPDEHGKQAGRGAGSVAT